MSDRNDFADATNGQATLSERVRELRLTGKMDTGRKTATGPTWLPWMLCAFLAVGWGGFGIRWYQDTRLKNSEGAPLVLPGQQKNKDGTTNVVATTPEEKAKPDAVTLEVKGYLIPSQQIAVSPIDVAGRVVKLNIEEGMSFKKGDILAEIDPTPYLAQKAEFVAQEAAAKARLSELIAGSRPEEIQQAAAELEDAKAQFVQARREWERFEAQKSNAITSKEYEAAEGSYRSTLKKVEARQKMYDLIKLGPRKERIDVSQAEYEAAKARLKQTEWKLDNCTIKSPVTGVILTKKAEVGSLLNPVVGGVSTSLCEIADLRKLEVDLEVQERDISKVLISGVCRIKADAYPDRVYEGYVERTMPIANRAKSVVPVRIKVVPRADEKQGQFLKPEMGVTVTFVNRVVDAAYKEKVRKMLEDEQVTEKK